MTKTESPSHTSRSQTWLRALAEQPVRLWLIATLAVLAISIFFTLNTAGEYLDERGLIVEGEPATGVVRAIAGDKTRYDGVPRDREVNVDVTVTRADGSTFEQKNLYLARQLDGRIAVGDELPLRIRPYGALWEVTDRTELTPIYQQFALVPALLVVTGLVGAVAAWKWAKVWRVARGGVVRPARVVAVRGTPLAPLKQMVRFAYDDTDDRRVHTLLHDRPAPAAGEPLDVLAPAGKDRPALAAGRYR